MIKKILLILSCVSVFLCGEQKKPQGVLEVFNCLGECVLFATRLGTMIKQDLKKGCQDGLDLCLNTDNPFLTPEENKVSRKELLSILKQCDEKLKQQFKFLKNKTVVDQVEFEEYKDYIFSTLDSIGMGSIIVTEGAVLGCAYLYPKVFAENIVNNKMGQRAARTILTPLGWSLGLGVESYVKLLSSDDTHPAVAWSKVVAFTGDGF